MRKTLLPALIAVVLFPIVTLPAHATARAEKRQDAREIRQMPVRTVVKQNGNVSGITMKVIPSAARINVKTVAKGVATRVMRNGNPRIQRGRKPYPGDVPTIFTIRFIRMFRK